MGQYSKPAMVLLCEQIQRDNPELDIELNAETLMLLTGPLTTNLGSSGRNTRIRVNGVMGKGTSGKRELFYDRIHLTTYTSKTPQGLVVTFDNAVHTVEDALPNVNAAFGLQLEPSDILSGTTVLPFGNTPTQITINVAPGCLNFTGLLTFKWRRGSAGYYPKSGPGSKQMLFGDMTEGYFGLVSTVDMLSPGEFFRQVLEPDNRGSVLPVPNPNLYWLKFALDDEIVYISSQPLTTNLSWETIYAAGAVDGSGEEVKFPPSGKPSTQQLALVTVHADGRDYYLRPRLPRISATDPCVTATGDPTSDVERLFRKVHKGPTGTGLWDTLPVGSGANFDVEQTTHWYLNSLDTDTTKAHSAALSLRYLAAATKDKISQWRPVLVLKSQDEILLSVRGQNFAILNVPPAIVIEDVILPTETDRIKPVTKINIALHGYPRPIAIEEVILPDESERPKPVTKLSVVLEGFAPNIPFTLEEGQHTVSVSKVRIGLENSPAPIHFTATRT